VATAALEALTREFGSRPGEVTVAIGPSIGACCYEVGSELVDAFAAAGHARHLVDRWFVARPAPRGSHERPRLRLDVAGANRISWCWQACSRRTSTTAACARPCTWM
jgi:copper oxidase (laccase) domain-containing protein